MSSAVMATLRGLEDSETLETLKALIDSASNLIGELASDPVFARMVRAFVDIPHDDREAVIAVLEREIAARRNADPSQDPTVPNPGPRLYTRIIVDEPRPDRRRAVLSAVRAIRALHEAVAPTDGEWKAVARQALLGLGPDERASMARLAAEVMKLVDECAQTAATTSWR
jgi:hypothetical protein